LFICNFFWWAAICFFICARSFSNPFIDFVEYFAVLDFVFFLAGAFFFFLTVEVVDAFLRAGFLVCAGEASVKAKNNTNIICIFLI